MKKLLLAVFFLFTFQIFGQKLTKVSYQLTDNHGVNLESYLLLNDQESLFYMIDTRKNSMYDGPNNNYYRIYNDVWSRVFYRNGNVKITRIPIYFKSIVYESPGVKISYSKERKSIGRFTCQKAILEKGGKKYEAWFDSSLPFEDGPMGLYGLPGLIIEAKELDEFGFSFHLKSIENGDFSATLDKYKQYLLQSKLLDQKSYDQEIIKLASIKKRENIAILAKYKATLEGNSYGIYTDHLIDIPQNLIKELDKIK
jgi:GLPGLI family protein